MLLRMKSMFSNLRSENDFKSTEFLVVLLIIIVLVIAALVSYSSLLKQTANTAHNANVHTLIGAIYRARVDNGAGDIDFSEGKELVWNRASKEKGKGDFEPGWEAYLEDWPEVPRASDAYKVAEEYRVYLENGGQLVKVEPANLEN